MDVKGAIGMTEELKKKVIEELKKVYDPEIPIDVWNLGLIYDLKVDDEGYVKVRMTMTVPGCPMVYMILDQVKMALQAIEGIKKVDVELAWDPPWTPEKMTKEGRKIFKAVYGYDIVEDWLRRKKAS